MDIQFKIADKNDVATIHQLADSIWKKHYPSIISMEQIEYMLKKMYSEESLLAQMNDGHQFTIVMVDGIPSGYISLSKKDNNQYFLHKFYVDVDKHRLGLGGKLFQHILSKIPQAAIELTVNRKNYKAINFYFKNGFVIKEVADFDIGNGYVMNDFVMLRKG
jgi:ribosomal protein S18 acetylase RimI-like enzyme